MQVGVTEIGEFLRCRRRWDYGSSNRQNLELLKPGSLALPLGTVIHAALGSWLQHPELSLSDFFDGHANVYITDLKRKYNERVGTNAAPLELEGLINEFAMGRAMMANYQEKYVVPLPEGFELVTPEQECNVPIPGTEHFLRGRLDAIIRNIRSGKFFVLEHKTYGNRPRDLTLRMTHQFIAYSWMLRQLNIGPVGGVAYDGMWKRAAPPKNRVFDDLFLRMPIEHTPHELAEFESMLRGIVTDMANDPTLYFNRTWDGSCDWGCQFSEACLAQSRGDDVAYILSHNYTQREPYGDGIAEE